MDLRKYGFAHGMYWNGSCKTCNKEFIGDKLSYNCENCAIEYITNGKEIMTTPNGLSEIINTFGDPKHYMTEDGRVDPAWEFASMGFAKLPMPVFLAWDNSKTIDKIYCHRKMIPVFEDVFQKIHSAGLWQAVQNYGGCYTWRLKRVNAQLSTHCWGISVDIDPLNNQLGTYGNMNQDVIDIFKDAGFIWGGDWKPKRACDPQHFQYCSGY